MHPVRLTCPSCKATVYVSPAQLGSTLTCANCLDEFPATLPQGNPISRPGGEVDPPEPEKPNGDTEPDADRPSEELRNPPDAAMPSAGTLANAGDDPLDADYEFDVECPLCGTRQDASRAQIGGRLRCPDCFFLITVREPPRRLRRSPAAPPPEDGELRLSDPVEARPLQSLAQDYMSTATVEVAAENTYRVLPPSAATGTPPPGSAKGDETGQAPLPHRPLTRRLLRFLADPRVFIRCLAIGIAMQIEALTILAAMRLFSGGPFEQFLCAGLSAFACVFGFVTLLMTSVTFLTILQDTAVGRDVIDSWPEGFFVDWLADGFYIVVSLFLAALPGVLLGQLALCAGMVASLYSAAGLAGSALSAFLLFPILLLSSLEAGSPWNVHSPRVRRSLTLLPRGWIRFYILSGALISLAVLAVLLHAFDSFVVQLVATTLVALAGMVYFRLLGRLAWCCREAVAQAETDEQTEVPVDVGSEGRDR
jgi:hypothetical protein